MLQTDELIESRPRTTGEERTSVYEKDVLSLWSQRRDSQRRAEPNADQRDTRVAVPLPDNLGIAPYKAKVRPIPREVILQEWEGRVEEIQGRRIVAHLTDITAKETEESEEVEIPIDDVPEADQHLIQPGAIFRWLLGYQYPYGRKEKFARIVVRRLPIWTEREMREADREANELYNAILGIANCPQFGHLG
jgi:hypothetical protein